jgi:FdhE protein
MLPALFEQPVQETGPALASDHAAAKLAGGVPLLRGEQVLLDIKALVRRWHRVCAAVEHRQDSEAAKALAEAVRRNRLDLAALAREALAGRPEGVHAAAEQLDVDPGLTATVLRLALFPALVSVNSALASLRGDSRWDRGYCPTCGSWPLLGEFRGLEQTRFLRCGLCAAEWEFDRLRCPFCDTRDHHQLGFLHVEGEEAKYRVAACDACRGYVKMVSSLSALSPPQLLVIDLATMHLDLAAAEQGYAPPA